jgi:hypothetical protein
MPKEEFQCAWCGKTRLRWRSQVRVLSFCDHKCKSHYMRIHTKGSRNSNYKHGRQAEQQFCSCGSPMDYRATQCYTCRLDANINISKFFRLDDRRRNATLWRYIKTLNLIPNDKCLLCGQIPFHNGKPLSLHLDHINGNSCDNRLENLRVICPNCHTQTDTYASKNMRLE